MKQTVGGYTEKQIRDMARTLSLEICEEELCDAMIMPHPYREALAEYGTKMQCDKFAQMVIDNNDERAVDNLVTCIYKALLEMAEDVLGEDYTYPTDAMESSIVACVYDLAEEYNLYDLAEQFEGYKYYDMLIDYYREVNGILFDAEYYVSKA